MGQGWGCGKGREAKQRPHRRKCPKEGKEDKAGPSQGRSMHLLGGKSFQERPGEDSLLHTAQNRAEVWKKERRGRTTGPCFMVEKLGLMGAQ